MQTLKGNVEASEKIEKTAGRDVVVWDSLSYVQGPDGKMVSKIPERYIFDAHSQEPVHATGEYGRRRPGQTRGHRVQVALPHGEAGLRVLRRAGPHHRPHPLQGHPELPRRERLLLRADHPLDEGPLPQDRCPSRASPRSRSPRPARPAGTPRSASSGSNRSPARPSTARRSTRRNCAAAPSSGDRDKVTAFAGHVKMREDYIESTVDLVKSNRTLVLLLTSYLPWGFLILGAAPAVALPLPGGPQPPPGRARGRPGRAEPEPVSA